MRSQPPHSKSLCGMSPHSTGAGGSFEVVCAYTHSDQVDPIVQPGVKPSGHMHDFFGNVTTDQNSVLASLLAGGTTCKRPQDKSGYWVPQVLHNGIAVTPSLVHVYYNSEGRSNVQPLPTGLEVVAGNHDATAPQSTSVVAWQCSDNLGPTVPQATPPSCGPDRNLKILVRFPECWDGVHLTSSDHQSHMAYYDPHTKQCDPAHPVPVVGANAEFKYPSLHDGTGLTLSSGSVLTLHGDFFDAWSQAEMDNLTAGCIDAGAKCGGSTEPSGITPGPVLAPTGTAPKLTPSTTTPIHSTPLQDVPCTVLLNGVQQVGRCTGTLTS